MSLRAGPFSLAVLLLLAGCPLSTRVGDADDAGSDAEIDGAADAEIDADCPPGADPAFDEWCGDAVDNDCDGLIDEGCVDIGAGCVCIPGRTRWCIVSLGSHVGRAVCNDDGSGWEGCVEASLPAECDVVDLRYSEETQRCLVDAGECAQDYHDIDVDGDRWESTGDCHGVTCPEGGCLCVPGARRWCLPLAGMGWGGEECLGGTGWSRCSQIDWVRPSACADIEPYAWDGRDCLLENGECVLDERDLDGDGDFYDSIGTCQEVSCE